MEESQVSSVETFTLPNGVLPGAATRETEYLQDSSVRRLVMELYDAEHLALRRYLSFLGIDTETGRELLHDAFVKLHEHLFAGGERTNLRAWLYRVAHNLARNEQASHRSSRRVYVADSKNTQGGAGAFESAEEELLEKERHRRFRAGLVELSDPQRECLLLRTRGMKYREIALVLNISVAAVGENVQRGMRRLRELL